MCYVVVILMATAAYCSNDVIIGNTHVIGGVLTPPHHQMGELTRCPWACSCTGLAVDCSHRGLTQVPRNLPTEAERVWVQHTYFYAEVLHVFVSSKSSSNTSYTCFDSCCKMSTLFPCSLSAMAYALINGGKLVYDTATVHLCYVRKLVCKLLAELVFTRTFTSNFLKRCTCTCASCENCVW